ncbi:hypothetical protein BS47DRAFT_1487927 [Hydnum rufescens UP504]|uniref:Uncharacterized protein n=1 Tax=Hydnum rufescens UP504 TaxID=1448309 RepID=A0A9P6AP84_9AGAM|nr:hypothetical protein BS47DRAFT_1487927 [Hydnum rufescens UP504]
MDNSLPTLREIELETLLQQKDSQLLDLTNDIKALRAYLPTQTISPDDPINVPPSLVSLLAPLAVRKPPQSNLASASLTAALKARVTLLQQENDELYSLLSTSTAGKLHEENKVLHKTISKLETALRESHTIISSLSAELDQAYGVISSGLPQPVDTPTLSHSRSHSPHYAGPEASSSTAKQPPTAPRAHKRPRLQDSPSSTSVPTGPRRGSKMNYTSMTNNRADSIPSNHSRERDRERERDRDRERERDRHYSPRERDWDRDPSPRRRERSPRRYRDRSPPDRARSREPRDDAIHDPDDSDTRSRARRGRDRSRSRSYLPSFNAGASSTSRRLHEAEDFGLPSGSRSRRGAGRSGSGANGRIGRTHGSGEGKSLVDRIR